MAIRLISKLFKQMRSNIITGVLLVIPLVVTVLIIVQLFQWIDSVLPAILGIQMPPGLGVLISIVIAYFAGLTAKNYFGRKLIAVGNNIIAGIPFLNKIYLTIQQIIDMVSTNKKQVFERAVLIEFPKENCYSIGFITSEANTKFSLKVGQRLLAVFLPTTPNPTSGYLLYVGESEVVELNIPVESAIKLVVSAGLLGADHAMALKEGASTMKRGWKWTDLFTGKKNEADIHDPRD